MKIEVRLSTGVICFVDVLAEDSEEVTEEELAQALYEWKYITDDKGWTINTDHIVMFRKA